MTTPNKPDAGHLRSRRDDACAARSAACGEPLEGTAGGTDAWLFVEHPGPWPSDAVDRLLGEDVVAGIRRRAPDVRVVLIRRPRSRSVERPAVIAAWSAGKGDRRPWMRIGRLDHYQDLLRLDLESLAAGDVPSFGDDHAEPLFLVCTHGKRDACCAEFGRPVLRALDAAGEDVWECTHIGGDRFAANLVCFPHAVYYGHLSASSALAATRAHRLGRVYLPNYRGRSGVLAPVQVAEHYLRTEFGVEAIDGIGHGEPVGLPGSDDLDVACVVEGTLVSVRLSPGVEVVPGGCGVREPLERVRWDVVGVREVIGTQ